MPNSLYLILALCFCTHLAAQTKINVVTENAPPLVFEERGVAKGAATEIVSRTLDAANFEYDISVLPWARAYRLSQSQANTAIYSMMRTKEREEKYHWIGEIYQLKIFLWKLKENKHIRVEQLSDLNSYRIGTVINDASNQWLSANKLLNNSKNDVVSNNRQNFEKLIAKRIDMFPVSELAMRNLCNKLGCKLTDFEKVILLPEISEKKLYFALSLQTPKEIANQAVDAYHQLKNDGIVSEILASYGL